MKNILSQGDLFDFARGRGEAPGRATQALETGRSRLIVTGLVMTMMFAAIGWRTVDLSLFTSSDDAEIAGVPAAPAPLVTRADIVDRNGIVVATSLPTVSVYANPKEILDPREAADKLAAVLPDLDRDKLEKRLASRTASFLYIKRNLTPEQHYQVHRLGLPGIQFERGERRVYPQGRLLAHVLGITDIDGKGTAGVERHFEQRLTENMSPLHLSIDLRVQAIVHDALQKTVDQFKALGAAAIVMDANTSELVSLVSLPDFDPNKPSEMLGEAGFNRATKGVYELGSVFKLLTAAMALDTGVVSVTGGYDASKPLRIARFTITDYHPLNRWLSVPEILIHSSNIGAAKMALDVGTKAQQTYLGRLGLLRPSPVELPEVGHPMYPATWREINTVTIAYGHGISIAPVQLANAIATVVNGGIHHPTTLLKQDNPRNIPGERVFSADTSAKMRGLMRLVVTRGTGRKADVPGYLVGGKTGTAEKAKAGGYSHKANISSFIGAFPIQAPRYVVLVVVDDPHGDKATYGYATGGWVAAPAVAEIVQRVAGLEGMSPEFGLPQSATTQEAATSRDATQDAAPETTLPAGLTPAAQRRIEVLTDGQERGRAAE